MGPPRIGEGGAASGRVRSSAPGTNGAALLRWIELLSSEIGPRRPTSGAERVAAERIRAELETLGVEAALEPFGGFSTLATPYWPVMALALAPPLLPPRHRLLRSLLALGSLGVLASEGSLVWTPVSDALSRSPSQNLVAAIEPRGPSRRTLVLVCHLDTSRSGVLFHPRLARHLNRMLRGLVGAVALQAAEPLLGGSPRGRRLLGSARLALAGGGLLLLERELRGEDVPGANDNASGVAVVAELARELALEPLQSTRAIVLMTGCEESALLGAKAFLDGRDTSGWLFVNFDSVGGPATLRFVRREGVVTRWDADPALLRIAEKLGASRPELGLRPASEPIGLTYDASPVLARGGRAITFVAGDDGVIPNYHWPTDTADRLDPDALVRALETGREMVRAIDRGAADT